MRGGEYSVMVSTRGCGPLRGSSNLLIHTKKELVVAVSRQKFLCVDCKIDTGKAHEHYFVKNDVWFSVMPSNKGMLCVGCIEARLGRNLTKDDFTDCSLNNPKYEPKSNRLMNRMAA